MIIIKSIFRSGKFSNLGKFDVYSGNTTFGVIMVTLIGLVLTVIVANVQLTSATNYKFDLSHQQITEIYDGFQFNSDIDTCSRFIDALLAKSAWEGPSDEWRAAGMSLVKSVATGTDLNGGLSIPADAKLLHCYKYLNEQNDLLTAIKQEPQENDLPTVDEAMQGTNLIFPMVDWQNVDGLPMSQQQQEQQTFETPTTQKPVTAFKVGRRPKTVRVKKTAFNMSSRFALEKAFQDNPRPSTDEIQMLADKLNVHKSVIGNWFRNKRQFTKKLNSQQDPTSLDEFASLAEEIQAPEITKYNPKGTKKAQLPRSARVELERAFNEEPNPSNEVMDALADKLSLHRSIISKWFQNQRYKVKTAGKPGDKAKFVKPRLGIPKLKRLALDTIFLTDPDPTRERIHELAEELDIEDKVLWRWFYVRRKHEKRQKAKLDANKQ